MWFTSGSFNLQFVSVLGVHPYGDIYTVAAWNKSRLILSGSLDFHMIDK